MDGSSKIVLVWKEMVAQIDTLFIETCSGQ